MVIEKSIGAASAKYLTIGIRGFAGSRMALLQLAARTLDRTAGLEFAGGNSMLRCFDASPREFLAMATLYRTTLSSREVFDVLAAVSTSLREPWAPNGPRCLEIILLWFEGEGLNPSLSSERWASMTFVEASEHALLEAVEVGTESAAQARAIAQTFADLQGHSPPPAWSCAHAGPRRRRVRADSGGVAAACGAFDEADLFAAAGELLVLATHVNRGADHRAAELRMERALSARPLRIAIEIDVLADREATLRRWFDTLETSLRGAFDVAAVVVWSATPYRIRGDVFGRADDGGARLARRLSVRATEPGHGPTPLIKLDLLVASRGPG